MERVKGVEIILFGSMVETYIELVSVSSAFSISISFSFSVEDGVMYRRKLSISFWNQSFISEFLVEMTTWIFVRRWGEEEMC